MKGVRNVLIRVSEADFIAFDNMKDILGCKGWDEFGVILANEFREKAQRQLSNEEITEHKEDLEEFNLEEELNKNG